MAPANGVNLEWAGPRSVPSWHTPDLLPGLPVVIIVQELPWQGHQVTQSSRMRTVENREWGQSGEKGRTRASGCGLRGGGIDSGNFNPWSAQVNKRRRDSYRSSCLCFLDEGQLGQRSRLPSTKVSTVLKSSSSQSFPLSRIRLRSRLLWGSILDGFSQ